MILTSDMNVTSALSVTTPVTLASSVTHNGDVAAELGRAVHELIDHQIDLGEFTRRFRVSRIYTLCPVCPGLFVLSRPGGAPIVPVWSTVRALRKVMGGYDWFARTGEDLVDDLPDGVVVRIDAGMPFPVDVPSSALLGQR